MSDLRLDHACLFALSGRAWVTQNGQDAYGRHAFSVGDHLRYSFRVPRLLGARSGAFSVFPHGSETACFSVPLSFEGTEGKDDVYFCLLNTEREALREGLYLCCLSFATPFGTAYAVGGNEFHVRWEKASVFQLTLSRYTHCEPAWLYGGTIYHVFVDRFCRGGNAPLREGVILNEDWENGIPEYPLYPGAPLANNTFFGGDLYGVAKKMPYIASLGTRAIYLSPIFRAASNHKYDTGDYGEVDEMFGGEDALRLLISEAKKYNIRILLDGVFNHTGDDSRYFNRYGRYDSLGAYQSPDSPYASWYTFTHFPDAYEAWWGIPILPKLNLRDPTCRAYFVGEDGILSRYAKMGIGGMRLDVADELDGAFIAEIKDRLCEETPDAVLYGEVWEDASNKIAYDRLTGYYHGRQLDGVMNYPLRAGLIAYLRDKSTGALAYYLNEVLPNMPKRAADAAMNLLGTHDTVRILTALGGASPEGKSNDVLARLRMSEEEKERAISLLKGAYLILATLPGIPCIYYGDEVGAEGYADPFNRRPFPWHEGEEDLLSHYRRMADVRRHAVYFDGELRLLHLSAELLVFAREKDGARAVTLFNNTDAERRVPLPDGAVLLFGEKKDKMVILPSHFGAIILLNEQIKKGESV